MHEHTSQWLRDKALSILDTAVDAIITIDEHGAIGFVNRATLNLFGYSEEELIGADVSILMPEPYRSVHQSYIDRFLQTNDPRIIGIGRELVACDKQGRSFPIYLAISELNDGGRRYFAGIVRDLSEQKAAEAALIEQRDNLARIGRLSTMGEMTASIAHEINQPLTAIAMYAQASLKLLERDEIDRERLTNALDKLARQSLRAGAIIERIQRFVRNDAGNREFVDLNDLFKELGPLIASDARMYGLELDLSVADDLPRIFVDPLQIQQVALNLVRNAIDAMREIGCAHGRRIRITARLANDRVAVDIADCGPGVSDHERDLLFEPFHTTKSNGMGMGLSISRSIVEAHGGVLAFRNNPDHGSTFSFTLPTEQHSE